MSEMFPCEQREVTEEYRENYDKIFSSPDSMEIDSDVQIELPLEIDDGTKRK